jgi:protein tyrosine phosphatase (PTP) superfamily phosphohydrolase (DUF442 family)
MRSLSSKASGCIFPRKLLATPSVSPQVQKNHQDKVEALGFAFRRMRPDNTALNDPEEMARMMDLKTGTEYVIKNWVCANLRETYTDLMDSAEDADFIITGEGVVAARLGV